MYVVGNEALEMVGEIDGIMTEQVIYGDEVAFIVNDINHGDTLTGVLNAVLGS